MTPQEAIEFQQYLRSLCDGFPPETGVANVYESIDMAIEALEKDIPVEMKDYYCPKCKSFALIGENGEYQLSRCDNCGQKLDWNNIE